MNKLATGSATKQMLRIPLPAAKVVSAMKM
jgi:hypothetical protein